MELLCEFNDEILITRSKATCDKLNDIISQEKDFWKQHTKVY